MSAQIQPQIEFVEKVGADAQAIDPEGIKWPETKPSAVVVVFAYEGDRIVGRSAILPVDVIEGTMVAEDKRGTSLAFRLLRRVEELYLQAGRTHAIAFAHDDQPEVAEYLERIGYAKSPLTVYSKQLVED